MKNIHVLSTDKPSRLYKFANELYLDTIPKEYYKKYNIHITSDEEIKEGDWVLNIEENTIFKPTDDEVYDIKNSEAKYYEYCKKIILTTDFKLAPDVQKIDDEFLEWFVKNPSCEEVEVKKGFRDGTSYGYNFLEYKIIIPTEEPKQERMYSEEDMKKAFEAGKKGYVRGSYLTQEYYFTWNNFKSWFEQFKKR